MAIVRIAHMSKVEDDAEDFDDPGAPEGGVIVVVLGQIAADQDSETDAEIPGGEEGGVGSAALIGRSQVDKHILEGWPEMSVAEADEQGAAVEAPDVVQQGKEQIADAADACADGGIVEDAALLQRAAANEARHEEAGCQNRKEDT